LDCVAEILVFLEVLKLSEMFFRDVVGQGHLKEKFITNINNGRISHAQLFLGPEGTGKLALAIAYARFLTCTDRGEDDACGMCSSCLKFSKLAHPDLNFFYPIASKKQGDKVFISKDYITQWRNYLLGSKYVSLNAWYNQLEMENKQGIINAEDCNEILRVLSYKSYESEYKIVIIWMIERLYHAAAPKLLKILEEPPPKTLFLLVSENQDQVLNTILSRTQIINIPRLSDEEVKNGLINLYNINPTSADDAAFLANGNFLQALILCENDETHENHTQFLRDWLRECYSFKVNEMLVYVETLAKMGREKQKTFLNFGLEIFRQCTLMNYQANDLVKAHSEAYDFITKFSKILSPDLAYLICEEFSKAIFHVERNANPKILFTDLSLKMSMIFMQAKK
jgi:DNA polymerase III subunit delta'